MERNGWIERELGGLYGGRVLREMDELIALYEAYEGRLGAPGGPERVRSNWIKKLIKDEARFMAGRPPEIRIAPSDGARAEEAAQIERWLGGVLAENRWQRILAQGVRDCLIGKRVALKLGGAPGGKLTVRFAPSLEFVYAADEEGLKKIVFFCQEGPDALEKSRQRIWRQRYELLGGRCYLDEGVYDGYGRLVEERFRRRDTGLFFIPAQVIVNDGLSGDLSGESDVRELIENQRAYDKLRSDDLEALKYNMFPQKVFVDASQQSIDKVVIAPNAMIDLATDPAAGGRQASASVLEGSFPYDGRLENALNRIKGDMYELMSAPNAGPEQSRIWPASGQAMKALYWGMICRCEEKWAGWDDALKWMAKTLVEMARAYGAADLPKIDFTVKIEHLYPVTDDEEAERALDLREVAAGARSRLSYIGKWQPGADAAAELERAQAEARGAGGV